MSQLSFSKLSPATGAFALCENRINNIVFKINCVNYYPLELINEYVVTLANASEPLVCKHLMWLQHDKVIVAMLNNAT